MNALANCESLPRSPHACPLPTSSDPESGTTHSLSHLHLSSPSEKPCGEERGRERCRSFPFQPSPHFIPSPPPITTGIPNVVLCVDALSPQKTTPNLWNPQAEFPPRVSDTICNRRLLCSGGGRRCCVEPGQNQETEGCLAIFFLTYTKMCPF